MPSILCVLLAAVFLGADTVEDLQRKAQLASQDGKLEEAVHLAGMAVALEPNNAQTYLFRGQVFAAAQRHAEAIQDFDAALKLNAEFAVAYQLRGSEHFKLGHIQESLADFDRYLDLRPQEKPKHWQRGISLYYARRFDEGAKQFTSYETVDTNDVENAVWHFLCVARRSGIPEARKSMLKIGHDRRVPLMRVYDLFRGKATVDDVLAEVRKGEPNPAEVRQRSFYAHLYLGLYAESEGDAKKALMHLKEAVVYAPPNHYMGDVARVHRDLLLKETKP
jgi:lipoprotein NlpI